MSEPITEQTNNGETAEPASEPSNTSLLGDANAEQQTDGNPAETTDADDQSADGDSKPEGAPESYEFKAPEGTTFDSKFLEVYSEVAKELNLSQDNAQKMIDRLSPVIESQQMARIEAVRNEWAETSRTDKEFGGDKLNENLSVAKAALDKFGTPELKELINKSGMGNHPELIRFFYRTGKSIMPDTFVAGNQAGKSAPQSFNDYADRLYT